MNNKLFKLAEHYREYKGAYTLMPFRFARIPGIHDKVLITSEIGEFAFVTNAELKDLVEGHLDPESEIYLSLQSKQFLVEGDVSTTVRMLAAKYRTKKSVIKGGPALHIFVVTLLCNHSCPYCQVSRQTKDSLRFEMSDAYAKAAIDRLFESPAKEVTIEFQGGEPLLAFEKIRFITEEIVKRNVLVNKKLTFSITTTLHFITEEILDFFKQHNFQVSTSIDGPADLHNSNRPVPGSRSYETTIEMLHKTREVLGIENVAALVTLTKASLENPEAIIDEYVKLDFRSIFLRPLSPYGFAIKSKRKIGYDVSDFLKFYNRALAYILDLNRRGIVLEEVYTSIILSNIFSPFPNGYVDLRSPTGSGLGVMVYNYDGSVYASDESRMLAEMGDFTFRLGNVNQSYSELIESPAMELILATGVAESLPGCSDCAFLPYCGSDPVFHLATQLDPVGNRTTSIHCIKHTHIFNYLFNLIHENDEETVRILLSWVLRKSSTELAHSINDAIIKAPEVL